MQVDRLGTNASASAVPVDMLRARVQLFLFVLFAIDICFHVLGWSMQLIGFVPEERPTGFSFLVVRYSITGMLGGAWLFVRSGCNSRRTLRILESGGTIVIAAMYLKLTVALPAYGPAFAVLISSVAIVLRAALVPSAWHRTLAVGLTVSALTVLMLVLHSVLTVVVIKVFLVLCGLAFVAVSVITSRVIYGLQRDVTAAKQLGQYELTRKLGEGGMGEVYEATHMLLRRPTAIKLLPASKVGEQTIARFEREVQQTSRLEHPNSVYIYDYGRTPDGVFYYAMEYLNGLDLQELIDSNGAIDAVRAHHILVQAAHALAEAHGIGLVHRDVKPANIMLCSRGGIPDVVKVLDFGLVKNIGASDDLGVTKADSIIGTPHYLAPEAIREPEKVGPAADVYALGAVGYYLVTGRPVFQAGSVVEVCAKHLSEAPIPPSKLVLGLPRDYEELILRCLDKDPAKRPANGEELATALEALDLEPWSAEEAHKWWDEFSVPPGPSIDSTGGRTLAIDVGGRLH